MAREQKGAAIQAIGRSRGGLTFKIHAVVDALGNSLQMEVTAGNINDCVAGYEILQSLDIKGKHILADRGYDTDKNHLVVGGKASEFCDSQL
ncbi:transposase [Paenibacillus glucanolyticus]